MELPLNRPLAYDTGRKDVFTMKSRFTRLIAGTLLLGVTVLAAPATLADEHEFGAFLYEGACDDVADATALSDIGTLELQDENEDAAVHWQILNLGNDALPRELRTGEAELDDDVTLDSLLESPHVVAIHSGDDSESDVIVCGEISGEVDAQGRLTVDLPEANDSTIEGRIVFESESEQNRDLVIGAWTVDEAQQHATPEGSPVATPAATPAS